MKISLVSLALAVVVSATSTGQPVDNCKGTTSWTEYETSFKSFKESIAYIITTYKSTIGYYGSSYAWMTSTIDRSNTAINIILNAIASEIRKESLTYTNASTWFWGINAQLTADIDILMSYGPSYVRTATFVDMYAKCKASNTDMCQAYIDSLPDILPLPSTHSRNSSNPIDWWAVRDIFNIIEIKIWETIRPALKNLLPKPSSITSDTDWIRGYIDGFENEVQVRLNTVRSLIISKKLNYETALKYSSCIAEKIAFTLSDLTSYLGSMGYTKPDVLQKFVVDTTGRQIALDLLKDKFLNLLQ